MPSTSNFPFRRIDVDHLVQGDTRIWWQLDDEFNDPGPYVYQLQVGNGGSFNSGDWIDVGGPLVDTYFAIDPIRRAYGKTLTTHYRLILQTAVRTYASNPTDVAGELDEVWWLHGRDIIRKEMLLHRKVSNDGYFLKRRRTGVASTAGVDPMTKLITDGKNPDHYGTGIRGGYYPALPMQCLGFSVVDTNEKINVSESPGPTTQVVAKARALGFPQILPFDVWVDAKSDERFRVEKVTILAMARRVPFITELTLSLLPFSDVIYRVPIDAGGNSGDTPPAAGTGCVEVDHNYGGPDELTYQHGESCGVSGATILAFTLSDWNNGLRTKQFAVGAATTGAGGRWEFAMLLDPGDYMLVFEKVGEYDPSEVPLTVVDPSSPNPDSSSSVGFGF